MTSHIPIKLSFCNLIGYSQNSWCSYTKPCPECPDPPPLLWEGGGASPQDYSAGCARNQFSIDYCLNSHKGHGSCRGQSTPPTPPNNTSNPQSVPFATTTSREKCSTTIDRWHSEENPCVVSMMPLANTVDSDSYSHSKLLPRVWSLCP